MHIHRSAHARNFTVLPNELLQDRQLTYTARGLLTDLLSRPDGWREDGRQMADSSPQGRGSIRDALHELVAAGYYVVEKVRMSDGTIVSEVHVFDTPQQVQPGTTRPVPGGAAAGGADALLKNPEKEPSLPADCASDDGPDAGGPTGEPPAEPDGRFREAVDTLFRVIRPEPRLRLGEAEARSLAPLVARWLERGATHVDLAHALLPGLPVPLHSPTAVLRNRLERKLPPLRATPTRRAAARYAECAKCHDPVPAPGICRPCAGLGPVRARPTGVDAGTARAGARRVREAVRAARTAIPVGAIGQWLG
ncbi:hypothetical protein [Streptomyces sp. TLI_171]|uniref:hypothetical protein n=1 Tax=Streptomyces sp. TLI_171 TaxID=1938859 RepID=UPI000C189395|nr:hypothetical protein [Streptomyces sp. TLI_171]RKE20078.1 hypothetical protein BX266_3422 [Streptomyces sp. TLI_171]